MSNFESGIYSRAEKRAFFRGTVGERKMRDMQRPEREFGTVHNAKIRYATVSVASLRNYSTSHLHFLVLCNTRVCSERKYWSVGIRIGMGFLKPDITTVYCRTRRYYATHRYAFRNNHPFYIISILRCIFIYSTAVD